MRIENPFWPNKAPSAAEAAKQWGGHGLLVHLSYTQIYTKSLIVLSVSLLDSHPSCGATAKRMRSVRNVNEGSVGWLESKRFSRYERDTRFKWNEWEDN